MTEEQLRTETCWFLCTLSSATTPFAPGETYSGVYADPEGAIDFLFSTEAPVLAIFAQAPRPDWLDPRPEPFPVSDHAELERYLQLGHAIALFVDRGGAAAQLQVQPVLQRRRSGVSSARMNPRFSHVPVDAFPSFVTDYVSRTNPSR